MNERMDPMEMRYDRLGPKVVENLRRRHFDAYYCQTAEAAKTLILSLIPKRDLVAWGGSVTMEQLGILEAVKRTNAVIDRDAAKTPEENRELRRQGLFADTFLMSSNAISEDGQLFNIDGTGNRVAALAYGPRQVIIAAGMNKVVKTIQDAELRSRNIAAPINVQRIKLVNPCSLSGTCMDCLCATSICASMLRTRICRPEGRIKVILVGENLGF